MSNESSTPSDVPPAAPAGESPDGAFGESLTPGQMSDVLAASGVSPVSRPQATATPPDSGTAAPSPAPTGAPRAFVPPAFDAAAPRDATDAGGVTLDMLSDVTLDVKVELGRTQMVVDDVLKLGPGSVVELDKLAGDPVDIYVNERLVARGEVLVLNDDFCVRISEIMTPAA